MWSIKNCKMSRCLQSPHSAPLPSVLKDGFLANHFGSLHPGSVTDNLGSSGLIAYSLDKHNPISSKVILRLWMTFSACSKATLRVLLFSSSNMVLIKLQMRRSLSLMLTELSEIEALILLTRL
ncbi:hypothetical protein NC652_024378 [Populus alba x Populus x berolinensis]|nr:hypothetical protein NC652_024378 [Populus alba x Populus x berolinensis]